MELIAGDVEALHCGIADFDALLIAARVERAFDFEPGVGGGCADQLHGKTIDERLAARPVRRGSSRGIQPKVPASSIVPTIVDGHYPSATPRALSPPAPSRSGGRDRRITIELAREPELRQLRADRIGADRMSHLGQRPASFAMLFDTHIKGRMGSPNVAGSTSRLSAGTSPGSASDTRRPPPARRTRPFASGSPSRSSSPRLIVERASPVIFETNARPPPRGQAVLRASLFSAQPTSAVRSRTAGPEAAHKPFTQSSRVQAPHLGLPGPHQSRERVP
jgi:hypothetical protein